MCDSDNEEFESADEELEDQDNAQTIRKYSAKESSSCKIKNLETSDVEPTSTEKAPVDESVSIPSSIPQRSEEPETVEARKIHRPDKAKLPEAEQLSEKGLGKKSSPDSGVATATVEGWDDFDDDWGDFSMESEVNQEKPKQASGTSFKDVDIDEVEYKLKDFMKRQNEPAVSSTLDRLSDQDPTKSSVNQSWGGWKPSWGGAAVSFLSSASKSVASITTNITQVLESGIGVPTAEEMAKLQAEENIKLKADGYIREDEVMSQQAPDRFGFDQIVSGVTQISNKVITGGLDTLEGIGKKTMNILQENDPGLLNKRKILGMGNDGVVLSQVLREAKEKTEERERNLKQVQKHLYKKKLHFETLFDDYHGLVHLEALEMLSKQASLKLNSLLAPLSGNALTDLQETMNEVKELCELPDSENDDTDGNHSVQDLEERLKEALTDLDEIKVDFRDLLNCWRDNLDWLTDESVPRTGQEIFEKAMHALAQTTALCVLRMHKLAEILLILEHHSTANEADAVVQLTTIFCWHLSGVAARFSAELSKLKKDDLQMRRSAGEDSDNSLITNIFLEGSNSTSYVQDAFQLFIPILQIGAA
ncbi:protein FAM114A2 [Toxorhynchites rutilus septentrionalis]|uniref:protein FAM114A2 n=1 Tax=Toxorhynchites rutilus septentrionalis TaxID=329112 RepID=UPI002479737D|nr:protein FAM114A2 [Toxorhynchites rutilus septentrionalis]